MTELLFGLTIVFVGYVIYEVFKTVSTINNVSPPEVEAPPPAGKQPLGAPLEEVRAATSATGPEPAPIAGPAPEPRGDAERKSQIRNPATGEVSAVPNNYRFAKRWIKEALVAEGLLDRIYKPGELDGAASEKVKEALEALRWMDKYQA